MAYLCFYSPEIGGYLSKLIDFVKDAKKWSISCDGDVTVIGVNGKLSDAHIANFYVPAEICSTRFVSK